MRRLLFIAAKKILSGFGRMYTYWTCVPVSIIKYGYYYNWYAVVDIRNIANVGARVISYYDYAALTEVLGGYYVSGGHLKESGILHWASPNTGADNSSGFSARGAGYRSEGNGAFTLLPANDAMFWSSTDFDGTIAYIFLRFDNSEGVAGASTYNASRGCSVRLIVDIPTEINGTSAIYVGNDGRRYRCCLIGGIWYLAENLAETRYRNGDLIEVETDNALWGAATTGKRCANNNDEATAFETKNIAPDGWRVPLTSEAVTLLLNWQQADRANALTDPNLKFWDYIYTANNASKWSARGAGVRSGSTGLFQFFKTHIRILVSDNESGNTCSGIEINNVNGRFDASINIGAWLKNDGVSLRFIKDDAIDPGTVTDVEGNVYKTMKAGNQVWTAESWKCRKYNDGTPISHVTDNTAWSMLDGKGAYCEVNNDIKNL